MDSVVEIKKIYSWWLTSSVPVTPTNDIVTELGEIIKTEPGSGSQDITTE